MSAAAKIESGATFGRWTVLRSAPPRRRYNEGCARARVLVRCVCGHEQAVFVSDLQSSKTRGCRSMTCWAQWTGALSARAAFERIIHGGGGV